MNYFSIRNLQQISNLYLKFLFVSVYVSMYFTSCLYITKNVYILGFIIVSLLLGVGSLYYFSKVHIGYFNLNSIKSKLLTVISISLILSPNYIIVGSGLPSFYSGINLFLYQLLLGLIGGALLSVKFMAIRQAVTSSNSALEAIISSLNIFKKNLVAFFLILGSILIYLLFYSETFGLIALICVPFAHFQIELLANQTEQISN